MRCYGTRGPPKQAARNAGDEKARRFLSTGRQTPPAPAFLPGPRNGTGSFLSFEAQWLAMSRRGRPPVATPEQVDKVRSLSAQKVSERKIAELVFGDARYRARVERILRRRGSSPTGDLPGEHSAVKPDKGAQAGEPELPSVRELLNRHRRRLASGGCPR